MHGLNAMNPTRAILGLLLASLPISAQAGPKPYVAFSLASRHIGASDSFNERNPGMALGLVWNDGAKWEVSTEAGAYHNSYRYGTSYAVAGTERLVHASGDLSFRAGGFAGLAYYPTDTDNARAHGVPVIGAYVMVAGASFSARYRSYEMRVRAAPGGEAAPLVATLQLGYRF